MPVTLMSPLGTGSMAAFSLRFTMHFAKHSEYSTDSFATAIGGRDPSEDRGMNFYDPSHT